MRKFATIMFLLAIAGCGGNGAEEKAAACRAADWWAIGYQDGVNGQRADRFGPRREACAKYGVTANITLYLDGRDQGLREYCKPANGYQLGVSGYRYANVCPADMEADFVDAHKEGFGLYRHRAAVDDAVNRLNAARQRSDNLELAIANKSTAMISPATPMADRISLGVEIKQLTQQKVDLEAAIPGLQADVEAARYELDLYRQSMSGRYSS